MHPLRRYIRFLIEDQNSKDADTADTDELLTEPDEYEGRTEKEVSSGGVAGVTTPLGTGPTYPPRRKNKKSSSS